MSKSIDRTFEGYRRPDGSVGTRNFVGVISTVVCSNNVTRSIVSRVPGAAFFTHQQGCCQTPVDIEKVNRTLISLGLNPNLHSVLLVSLGCESTDVGRVAEMISKTGKRVEIVEIQGSGGASNAINQGVLLTEKLVREASKIQRETCEISDLVLGLKCGSSDTTSGLISNPALGRVVDLLIDNGGSAVLGETTECIGAEHILVTHAANKELGDRILRYVERIENRAKSIGVDMRGGQPTGGNIKGGLTTIEEKSLGAIAKAGKSIIKDVFEYGDRVLVKGLSVMDSPGREPELLTGLAASGCNVIAFTTGRGAPQGFPFVPVVKITGNSNTARTLSQHIDVDVSPVLEGKIGLEEAAKNILSSLCSFASGEFTQAEVCGYGDSMDIYVTGPVI